MMLMPRDDDEISEKSQKSRVEDIAVALLTSHSMVKTDEILMEETFEEHPLRINMVDKLVKAARKYKDTSNRFAFMDTSGTG